MSVVFGFFAACFVLISFAALETVLCFCDTLFSRNSFCFYFCWLCFINGDLMQLLCLGKVKNEIQIIASNGTYE